MTNIIIRRFTIDDYGTVYALWRRTPGMGLNDKDDSRVGISMYLSRNPNTCFVAECDNEIIGVIMGGHDGRRGYIHHTCVAEGMRQHGIGTRLVDAALAALKGEGINKVALVVYGNNTGGNAFWEKAGFTKRPDLVYRDKALTSLERIDT